MRIYYRHIRHTARLMEFSNLDSTQEAYMSIHCTEHLCYNRTSQIFLFVGSAPRKRVERLPKKFNRALKYYNLVTKIMCCDQHIPRTQAAVKFESERSDS